MRIPYRRVTVRRSMAAVAFVASCLACLRSDLGRPSHRYQCRLCVQLPAIAGRDGRESPWPPDDESGGLISPAVLDEALKDGLLSTLPRLYDSEDPREVLRRMLSVRRNEPSGPAWITLSGETPAESFFAAAALDGAIRAKGPPGVIITRPAEPVRMPSPPGLLDRRWKILAATAIGVILTITILLAPWPWTAQFLVLVLLPRVSRRRRDTPSHHGILPAREESAAR